MLGRSLKFAAAASLIVGTAGLAGCHADAPDAIGVATVDLALIAGASHGGAPFTTKMTQEVTTTPPHFGDADGTGTARLTINHGQRELCWDLTVSDVTLPATAAHIHKAAPGVRGPIVVGLSAPDASGRRTGCAADVDRAILRDILTHSGDYYVNVHTTDYPAGAVRGQLGQ